MVSRNQGCKKRIVSNVCTTGVVGIPLSAGFNPVDAHCLYGALLLGRTDLYLIRDVSTYGLVYANLDKGIQVSGDAYYFACWLAPTGGNLEQK